MEKSEEDSLDSEKSVWSQRGSNLQSKADYQNKSKLPKKAHSRPQSDSGMLGAVPGPDRAGPFSNEVPEPLWARALKLALWALPEGS